MVSRWYAGLGNSWPIYGQTLDKNQRDALSDHRKGGGDPALFASVERIH